MAIYELSMSVQYAICRKNLPTRQQFRRWVKVAQQCNLQIVLRIVEEKEGQTLNAKFRGKNYATNVLTFSYIDKGQTQGTNEMLYGDVVLCAPVVEREAREQCKDLHAHYAHLVIHAALHLQGYDHENEQDAALMEALEVKLMTKLKYEDPYKSGRIQSGCLC